MAVKKIGIIGLGLIGGSIAKALRYRLGIRNIVAVDKDQSSLSSALKDGVICSGLDSPDTELFDCNIIFICTPVKAAIEHLKVLSENVGPECIITDVGSTKTEIVEFNAGLAKSVQFIGGHPMAGSEKAGYFASTDHMFENAYYVICPSKNSTAESITMLTGIIAGFGAIPVVMNPQEHDKVTGCISHLPHIAASALVNMVRKSDSADSKMKQLAAGGFKDITRIASSNPQMWENIVLSNKDQLISIMDLYIQELEYFKSQLEKVSSANIYDYFLTSKVYRDSFSSSKKGLLPSIYELIVDVEDKPGIIGEIATLLGSRNINIKNINISNSREFEQGCLRITFSDDESSAKSMKLLVDAGYSVFKCC